tara:strand:+ start:343 stop:510 length:168 start_codon:yes stop_codon:yes gene_type:complete
MECFAQKLMQKNVILSSKEWKIVLDLIKIGAGEKARDSEEAEQFILLEKKVKKQL